MNSSYQEVVNRLQYLTHNYNNSPYLTQTKQLTHNRPAFLNDSTFSSSNSTTSDILFTSIPTPSYHDYTFNNNKNPNHHTIKTNVNHLQSPTTPTITTRLHILKTPDSINSNSFIPSTPIDRPTDRPTTSKPPPDCQSDTSSNDDFSCLIKTNVIVIFHSVT